MKIKTSERNIRVNFKNIVNVKYGALQHTLSVFEPLAYASGVYGHNSDFYQVDNFCISMGSSPIGNVKISTEKCKEIESKTQKIIEASKTYKSRVARVQKMFVKELKKLTK